MKELETIGQEIRRRRKALNLTQKELARLLNTPQSQVARWEKDAVIPLRRWQLQISSVLSDEERMYALLTSQELTGEDALRNVVTGAFVAAIDQIKPAVINICFSRFISPEIEKIQSQGKGFNLDDIWLIQLMFWEGSRGPEIRFNEKVKADLITRSSIRNWIPGKISREEIENLNPQDLDKITPIEKGVSNITIFKQQNNFKIGSLELHRFVSRSPSIIASSTPYAKMCAAEGCEVVFPPRGNHKKYCSPRCRSREGTKRYRGLM